MRTLHIVLTIAMLVSVAVPSSPAQQPASAGIIPTESPFVDFEETPDGNWRTTVTGPDGQYDFVFVPPTKVEPRLRLQLSPDPNNRLPLTYRYEITNGPGAQQELARLFFMGVNPSTRLVEPPRGWVQNLPQTPGAITVSGPLRADGVPSGIRPGERDTMVMSGYDLPGMTTVRTMGDTLGAVVVPSGLTERQYEELSRLNTTYSTLTTPAIGPTIPLGVHEPEMTFAVLLARVASHYMEAVRVSRHPHENALSTALTSAVREDASLSDPAVQSALTEALAVAVRPVTDPFHQDLSDSLHLCIEILLSGKLPLAESERLAIVQELREWAGVSPR